MFSATFRHVRKCTPLDRKGSMRPHLPGRCFVEKNARQQKTTKKGDGCIFWEPPHVRHQSFDPQCLLVMVKFKLFHFFTCILIGGLVKCQIIRYDWNTQHDQICQQITICYPHLKPVFCSRNPLGSLLRIPFFKTVLSYSTKIPPHKTLRGRFLGSTVHCLIPNKG